MKTLNTIPGSRECAGECQECGKTHIKLFGAHDTAAQLLRARVMLALEAASIDGKVIEVAEPAQITLSGVSSLPALMVEGVLYTEGVVPSVEQIADLIANRNLHKSKLFRLRRVSVPVDMSPVSANALRFGWRVAEYLGAQLEVVYVMDSIFEGSKPSASGFLSGYQATMKTELDTFITESLRQLGVTYLAPDKYAGEPADMAVSNAVVSKVIYGAPDVALESYSRGVDLIVMGTTGSGNLGKKFFGSVSAEVSRNAHCPVLFIPKEAEFRGFSNLLYASDFDSLNGLSVQQAVSFARRFDGQIHFVHAGAGGEEGLERQRKIFEAEYGSANPDRPFIFNKMVSEDITGALYEYAFYHRIDLIVFVTHHRKFWENILHKSVTNSALLTSDLPILVIHSDDDQG
jgi:nucleotide-binding universal stress UspA family protein